MGKRGSGGGGGSVGGSKRAPSLASAAAIAIVVVAIAFSLRDEKASHPDALPQSERALQDDELPVLRPRLSSIKDTDCSNRRPDAECMAMAKKGDCEQSPGWMWVMCPRACNACMLRNPKYRCVPERMGLKSPLKPGFKPGEMDVFFETLPKRFPEYKIEYLHQNKPWIVVFHNFLSDKEVKALIAQTARGMRRSTDQGTFDEEGVQEQVVSTGRTSTNSWCDHACEATPDVRAVTERIEKITAIPRSHYESFQVLRYEVGQEYNVHHDSSEDDNELISGPRILTFFLYLSDVEEGGGTNFPKLNITMNPRRGDAILWPSVLSDDLTKIDEFTYHAALPVKKGIKYAANHWIHLYNYRVPNLYGCTGSFD